MVREGGEEHQRLPSRTVVGAVVNGCPVQTPLLPRHLSLLFLSNSNTNDRLGALGECFARSIYQLLWSLPCFDGLGLCTFFGNCAQFRTCGGA